MRLLLLLAILLVPLAASLPSSTDPQGDESWQVGPYGLTQNADLEAVIASVTSSDGPAGLVADCSDPAIDLTTQEVVTDADTITAILGVADMAGDASCRTSTGDIVPVSRQHTSVSWLSTGFVIEVRKQALLPDALDPLGQNVFTHRVLIRQGIQQHPIPHGFTQNGGSYVVTFPNQGTLGGSGTYDLRGLTQDVSIRSSSGGIAPGASVVSFRDEAPGLSFVVPS
jgi:hypothetical protein